MGLLFFLTLNPSLRRRGELMLTYSYVSGLRVKLLYLTLERGGTIEY